MNRKPIILNHRAELFDIIRICLTEKCNLNCSYCFNEGYNNKPNNNNPKFIKKILEDHLKIGGTKACISGGEPLCHPNFTKYFKMIKNLYHENIHLTTNGINIKKDMISIFKNIGRINITIPSFKIKKYEQITGGNYLHRVLGNIDFLLDNSCQISINFILIPGFNDNNKEISDLIEFSQKKKINISILKLYNTNIVDIDNENYFKKFYKIISKYCSTSEIVVNKYCPPISLYKLDDTVIVVRDFYYDVDSCQYCTDCDFKNMCEEGLCQPRLNEDGLIKGCLLNSHLVDYDSNYKNQFNTLKNIYLTANSRWIRY